MTRFLEGLKEEIRSAITLHRPKTIQDANELASLPELELELQKPKFSHKNDSSKFQNKQALHIDKPKLVNKKDEVKNGDAEDKLVALRSFRRANNLCFTCGEKWTGRGHKFPTHVSIHVIQELLDAVQAESKHDYDSAEGDIEVAAGQVVMAVQCVQSSKKSRTLRFKGNIGQQEILILLDSGSFGTFINLKLATKLQLSHEACNLVSFMAADGSTMLYEGIIHNVQWHIQGHTFQSDTRILPFKGYDLILGAYWLEDHSPMWFHWKKKYMKFTKGNRRILLQGVRDELTTCSQVPGYKLKELLKKGAVTHIPELQHVQSLPQSSIAEEITINAISESTMVQSEEEKPLPSAIQSLLQQYDQLF